MDYKEFQKSYEQSGLTQSSYGKQHNISSSMVSYYLKKAREQSNAGKLTEPKFTEIKIESATEPKIIIKTINGTEIHIPL